MNGLQKFYIGLWVAFGSAIAGLFVFGMLDMFMATVIGFAAFGVIFMGMMCVLPSTVAHPGTPKEKAPVAQRERISLAARVKGWFTPHVAVKVSRPHFR